MTTFASHVPVRASALQAMADVTDAIDSWTDFSGSVLWTATSVNPAIVNGSISAHYIRSGDFVAFRMTLTMGAGTTYGTGSWILSLPVQAFAMTAVSAIANDFSTSLRYPGAAMLTLDSVTTMRPLLSGGVGGVSSTVPFTWAVSDQLTIGGVYRAEP